MFVSYAEEMSEKTAEREAFGPRPEKKLGKRHEMKFRLSPELYRRLQALAEVEMRIHKSESGEIAGHISENAELTFILEQYVKQYEEAYGPLPDPTDEAALQRHVKQRLR